MPPAHPRALPCEYQVDPIGLGTREPRFFWKLHDGRPGAVQSAYRVLVASDPDRLAAGEGDLWDIGKVASQENAYVVCGGAPLASRQRAFWKVQNFDAEGESSPWSAVVRTSRPTNCQSADSLNALGGAPNRLRNAFEKWNSS